MFGAHHSAVTITSDCALLNQCIDVSTNKEGATRIVYDRKTSHRRFYHCVKFSQSVSASCCSEIWSAEGDKRFPNKQDHHTYEMLSHGRNAMFVDHHHVGMGFTQWGLTGRNAYEMFGGHHNVKIILTMWWSPNIAWTFLPVTAKHLVDVSTSEWSAQCETQASAILLFLFHPILLFLCKIAKQTSNNCFKKSNLLAQNQNEIVFFLYRRLDTQKLHLHPFQSFGIFGNLLVTLNYNTEIMCISVNTPDNLLEHFNENSKHEIRKHLKIFNLRDINTPTIATPNTLGTEFRWTCSPACIDRIDKTRWFCILRDSAVQKDKFEPMCGNAKEPSQCNQKWWGYDFPITKLFPCWYQYPADHTKAETWRSNRSWWDPAPPLVRT